MFTEKSADESRFAERKLAFLTDAIQNASNPPHATNQFDWIGRVVPGFAVSRLQIGLGDGHETTHVWR
ncbi:hypothetical protein FTUN_6090 [Frigoriglobus tundricola]|uniref:Uncharacterized protein n=1 Tax=Frigoriglobus tundricola TaxID=2774151 RepID=A0A6M5YYE7_9BACT|nr:hypothetical protein FTUN_6090 [Frigoriglobus tundricola]